MAPAASACVRSWRRCSFSINEANTSSELQEIPQQLASFARQHGFGVELHAVHRIGAVPDAHDRAVLGLCGHLERLRQRLGDDQRVIPAGHKWLLDATEDTAPIVLYRRR